MAMSRNRRRYLVCSECGVLEGLGDAKRVHCPKCGCCDTCGGMIPVTAVRATKTVAAGYVRSRLCPECGRCWTCRPSDECLVCEREDESRCEDEDERGQGEDDSYWEAKYESWDEWCEIWDEYDPVCDEMDGYYSYLRRYGMWD